MKLKSLIAFVGVACAAASYGTTTVTTSNTLCRIKFTTSENEVLIGLPLVDVGGTTQTINATNYISTVGLEDGATLLGKVNGVWNFWEVSNKAWAKVLAVNGNSTYTAGDNASFARGSAVRLKFNDSAESHTVYLYGQVANASTTGDIATTATRSTTAPTYTLLSNINASRVAIGSLPITGQVKGDKIALLATGGVELEEYTWNGQNWIEYSGLLTEASQTHPIFPGLSIGTAESDVANKTFEPGEGFFYITTTNGTETAASFNWAN